MYKALYLSPMIPSYDVRETIKFFTSLFGFSVFMDSGNYAVLHRNNLTVHILNASNDIGEMEFYLDVDDVNGLWAKIKDKVTDIEVKPPFDREYGMREFHIIIPHTKTLMFIGQVINQES